MYLMKSNEKDRFIYNQAVMLHWMFYRKVFWNNVGSIHEKNRNLIDQVYPCWEGGAEKAIRIDLSGFIARTSLSSQLIVSRW